MQIVTEYEPKSRLEGRIYGVNVDPILTTQLFVPNGSDMSYINQILRARNLGERFVRVSDPLEPIVLVPSEMITRRDFLEAAHSASWLGMVACASGVATGLELLEDNGLIHNIIHLANYFKPISSVQGSREIIELTFDSILKRAIDLERRTPGFQKHAYHL